VETNGTIDPLLPAGPAGAEAEEVLPFDWAVVSPKPPDYRVAPAWDEHIDELKLVVDDVLDVSIAERLAARYPGAFVSIQPEFGGRPDASEREWDRSASASVRRAIALVITHPDWRLSLQTHKLLGIR
jgi:organic radical activating enzyme